MLRYPDFASAIDGGLVTSKDATLIQNDESPDLLNISFDSGTAKKRSGSRKINAIAVREGGLRFDGVSGWLYVPDVAAYHVTDVLTWECVVKFEALSDPLGGSGQVLVSKYNNNPANQLAFVIQQTVVVDQRIQATWRQAAGDQTLVSTGAAIATGVRYHIALVLASGRQNLFVTNLETSATGHATSTFAGAISSITEPLITGALGRDANGRVDFSDPAVAAVPFDVPANMVIDEIRFWHAALQSGAAMSTALSAYKNRELDTAHPNASSLLGYWRLNDRNGLAANDDVLTINTSGTPSVANRGFLEPRHGSFVDGIVDKQGGFAIHLDGYTDFATVPTDDLFSANVQSAYTRAFALVAASAVRPVWAIEFTVTVPASTGVNQPLFHWVTDAAGPDNVILNVYYNNATQQFDYTFSYQTLAGATDATTTITGGGPFVAGQVIGVAVTRDLTAGGESAFTAYENGASAATFTTAAGQPAGPDGLTQEIRFGSDNTLSGFAAINIDEIRIWYNGQTANADVVARTAAQIAQYWDKPLPVKERVLLTTNAPMATGTKLIHYWTCDDNFRDYNDAPPFATSKNGTLGHTGALDGGGSQTITATERVLGGLPLRLSPGSHVPEWAPGLLSGEVLGGLFDAVKTFKKSDGTQQLVCAAEGALLSYALQVVPGAFTTILASGFQGGKQAATVLQKDRIYLTNGLSPPLVYDGVAVRRWGIQGPTFAPVSFRTPGGTSTAGDVQYRYTWVNRDSGVESNPSPASAVFRDQAALAPISVGLFHSPDPQVSIIRIYRTRHGATSGAPKPGSSDFYFVDEITNVPGQTTPSSYTDLVGDASLGFPLDSRQAFTIGSPPPWTQFAVEFNGLMVMANDPRDQTTRTTLFFSESLEPERFGALNAIDTDEGDGEPITGLAVLFDRLFIFKRSSIQVLAGSGPDNFNRQVFTTGLGCFSHFAIVHVDGHIFFPSDRGPYDFNGTTTEWIGEPILPTFAALDKTQFAQAAGGHVKDRRQVWIAMPSLAGGRNDTILVWDYERKNWSLFKGLRPQCLDSSIDFAGVNRIFFGDDGGFLWRGDTLAASMDGDLGFVGTVKGTITSVGTASSIAGTFVTITDTGASFHVADPDNLKGVRYEIQQTSTGLTAEGRVLLNSNQTLTLDKTAAQLGFTPAAGDTYRLMAIDAYITTKEFDLGDPALLKRIEETELEMVVSIDGNGSGTSVIDTLTRAVDGGTLGNAENRTSSVPGGPGTSAQVWERFSTPARGRRFQVKLANDRTNERFEVKSVTIRSRVEGRM